MCAAVLKDGKGRDWPIVLDVNSLRRVRQLTGENLAQDIGTKVLARIAADPILLVDTLWAIVEPEAAIRKITPEQFAESLTAEALDKSLDVLLEGLADFFSPAKRELLSQAHSAFRDLEATAIKEASAELEQLRSQAAATPSTTQSNGLPTAGS